MKGVTLVALFGAACIMLVMCSAEPPPTTAAKDDGAAAARAACREFVERAAHDPSSVDFGDYWYWPTAQSAGGVWTVQMKFRAKNGFGAIRLSSKSCVVRDGGADRWALVSLR